MGKLLARLVDGIKARLQGRKKDDEEEEEVPAAAACYGKMEKTESMRVEIRSRRARELIAKNLAAADSIGKTSKKRSFFAF